MLILFVALNLRWLPISGHVPVLQPLIDGEFVLAIQNFPEAIRHLFLPAITLGAFSLAVRVHKFVIVQV